MSSFPNRYITRIDGALVDAIPATASVGAATSGQIVATNALGVIDSSLVSGGSGGTTTVNGLSGAVIISGGQNITIGGTGQTILISAASGSYSASGNMSYVGAWNGAAAYSIGNVVTASGASYVCILPVSVPTSGSQYIQSHAAAGTSNSYPSNVTIGNLLIVFKSSIGETNVGATLPTDTLGNTYQLIGTAIIKTGDNASIAMFAAISVASGPNTVTASLGGGSPISIGCIVSEFSHLGITPNATTSVSNAYSGVITPTIAGTTIIAGVGDVATSVTFTPETGFTLATQIQNASGQGCIALDYKLGSAALSTTAGFAVPEGTGGLIAAAFPASTLNPAPSLAPGYWVELGITTGGTAASGSNSSAGMVQVRFDDGTGLPPASGQYFIQPMPYSGAIVSANAYADVSGSMQISVSKATSSTYPTFTGINAYAPPSLANQNIALNLSLTGWTLTFNKGDIFKFTLNSASTLTWIVLDLLTVRY